MLPPWLTYLGEKGGELWAEHMGYKKWSYWEHNEEHIGNLGTPWEHYGKTLKTEKN